MCDDIKPMWLKLARRCQALYAGSRRDDRPPGFAVMTVRALVGPDGQPVMWAEPEMHKIEPSDRAQLFLYQIIERMSE